MAVFAVREFRRKAAKRQGGRCFWCGVHMVAVPPKRMKRYRPMPDNLCTADHLVEQILGGPDTEENIVAACLKCNARRGELTGGAIALIRGDWPTTVHVPEEIQQTADLLLEFLAQHGERFAIPPRKGIVRWHVNKFAGEQFFSCSDANVG